MCVYCNQEEMQYALMEITDDRMIIIDALEFEMINKVYESKNIQNAIEQIDKEKVELKEDFPLKIVSGVIFDNPHFSKDIVYHIKKNFINKVFTTYLEDRVFHDFLLVDIEMGESNERCEVPFYALIRADFNVKNTYERAITSFVSYGNLSTFESLLNRDFILSMERQYDTIKNLSETNWKNNINF